jgi:hypothetical protein
MLTPNRYTVMPFGGMSYQSRIFEGVHVFEYAVIKTPKTSGKGSIFPRRTK